MPEDSFGGGVVANCHVVKAGRATIGGGGTVTVTLSPHLGGSASDYIVVATDTHSTVAAVNCTSLSTSSMILKGTATHVIYYAIVKTT